MKKTFSFAVVHFTVAFAVTYALTGSWVLGGLVAMIEPMVNTVAYHFHEKVWDRIRARREANETPQATESTLAGA
ncbi:DUF2061 domain-containing protein [Thiorhodospira sibirica]|uniref:DUF2061 domain-containing protein n=1 Tax=Thiorhodospira sibirica TaxID=154347 RepID=UPI00022C0514|nr:DUF2061 domain-containing protein [Thiorhodospira sibirica]